MRLIFVESLRKMCPIQLHLRILISCSIGLFHKGQVSCVRQKNVYYCTQTVVDENLQFIEEILHVLYPYVATGSKFDLKVRIFVVVANCAELQRLLRMLWDY